MSKDSTLKLLNYQDGDADLVTRVIPELVKLLNEGDQVAVSQAAMAVYELSNKEAPLHAIMNSPQALAQLVTALARTMTSSNDPETTRCAAAVFYNLSPHPQGLLAIFVSGAIPALVTLLSSSEEIVLGCVVTTLYRLLSNQEGSDVAVRLAGGIEKMVAFLQRDIVHLLVVVIGCLEIFAYDDEDKLIILSCGGTAELVRIMRSYTHENLLWITSRVLSLLSRCPSNKRAILEAGGIQALAKHLGRQNLEIVLLCLWTLRMLSDLATEQVDVDPLLQDLLQLLRNGGESAVFSAACILINMNCNSRIKEVEVEMAESLGWRLLCVLETLVCTVNQAGDREENTEPAIFAPRSAETEKAIS